MESKKENFENVLNTMSQYKFIKHPKTPEQVSEVKKSITKRLEKINQNLKKKIVSGIGIVSLMLLMAFGFTGCNKDLNDNTPTPQIREKVTLPIQIRNFVSEPMSKSFDINKWIWIYNPNQYNLVFTNPTNPVDNTTVSLSINQMIAGASVSLYRGSYNLSFISTHTSYQTLDASINMSGVNIQDTPIYMTGKYEDALVVIDLPNIISWHIVPQNGIDTPIFTKSPEGFLYAYIDQGGRYDMPVTVHIDDGSQDGINKTIPLYPLVNGNVYLYCSVLGAQTNLTFPQWVVNRITI